MTHWVVVEQSLHNELARIERIVQFYIERRWSSTLPEVLRINTISVTMLTEIYYALSKMTSSREAHDILLESLSYLNYCDVSSEDAFHCLEQRWGDLEDCLVARCAEKVNADYIITRNTKDFVRSAVPALTPTELLALLESEEGLTYQELDLREYLK